MQNQHPSPTIQPEKNAGNDAKWIRGIFMIVLFLCGWLAGWLVGIIALFQFLSTLLTGKHNVHLLNFAKGLSAYINQIVLYLTYNSEEKAFPFGEWPGKMKSGSH